MNLKPLVSSKRCAALIRPKFPSLIKSLNERPWCWYCLATDTTKRRLACTSLSNARWSPILIFWASVVSSSGVIIGILEISCKYFSTAWESRLVIWVAILSCLMGWYYFIWTNKQAKSYQMTVYIL